MKKQFKNADELLRAILKIIPGASIGEDNDGQIVIYTNLSETDKGVKDMGDYAK
jgi:hypothetical protein